VKNAAVNVYVHVFVAVPVFILGGGKVIWVNYLCISFIS
jgi:hypothetical protein